MNPSSGATVALTCHPTTPCGAVRGIQVEIRRASGHCSGAALRSRRRSEPPAAFPLDSTPRRADKLWQHTCFELFCTAGATTAYYELNFSPSSEWAIYRFDAYREGMTAVETQHAPQVSVHQHPGGLNMDAIVDLERSLRAARLPGPAARTLRGHRGSGWPPVLLGTCASCSQTRLPSRRRLRAVASAR